MAWTGRGHIEKACREVTGGIFGMWHIILFEFNFIQQGYLQRISISNKFCSFILSVHQRILKKRMVLTKILSINYIVVHKKCFLSVEGS